MTGVNAAVVGLLAAALYQPLWTTSVTGLVDFALILVGFVLLTVWRTPPLIVVATMVTAELCLEVLASAQEIVALLNPSNVTTNSAPFAPQENPLPPSH